MHTGTARGLQKESQATRRRAEVGARGAKGASQATRHVTLETERIEPGRHAAPLRTMLSTLLLGKSKSTEDSEAPDQHDEDDDDDGGIDKSKISTVLFQGDAECRSYVD